MDTTPGCENEDAKARRWKELTAHWRAHGAPGVLRPGYRQATTDHPVLHDHTGEQVGRHTEHWSGRVDAHVEKVQIVANPNLIVKQRNPE